VRCAIEINLFFWNDQHSPLTDDLRARGCFTKPPKATSTRAYSESPQGTIARSGAPSHRRNRAQGK
jgi:hypothetical protein